VVIDGSTGTLVPIRQPEQLAREILRALNSPDRCIGLAKTAQALVAEMFSVERTAREVRDIYAHVLRLREEPPVHFDPLSFLTPQSEHREHAAAATSITYRNPVTSKVKRTTDIAVVVTVLTLASPVLAITAALIPITMGRPMLFRQVRPGLNERPFTLLKFRTMRTGSDSQGQLLPDADRLTDLGRFLRKFSVDELPQLWNVLCGHMSLVGPRPLLNEYLPRYSVDQRRRHRVRPGITGWAQVNGRNALTWEQKFALDLWYVDHWSLWLDLKILWLTLLKVVQRDGISQQGHATMPEFTGAANVSGQHE
jgi:lipopolysaccharide/colanic/teichoic acid biosynthesis glycosyltransferase